MPKSVGTLRFFKKSYKYTRTNISAVPYGAADIFMRKLGSKERPVKGRVKGL